MAMRKAGSRLIVVDGVRYRWRIRPRGTYDQTCYSGGTLVVSVVLEDSPGCTLILQTTHPHPQGFSSTIPLRPREVASAIRKGLEAGWTPQKPGRQFSLAVETIGIPEELNPALLELARALKSGEGCTFALHDSLLEAGYPHLAEHFRTYPDQWVLDLILKRGTAK